MEWRKFFCSAQSQILGCLALLMAIATVTSVFTIRHLLLSQKNERVQRSLEQEAQEIKRLAEGNSPVTGQHLNRVSDVFDIFLFSSVPDDDEFFITLLDGKLYRTSPLALPKALSQDSALIRALAESDRSVQGEISDGQETIAYLAQPIAISEVSRGVFVVAHALSNQQREIDQAALVAAKVIASIMALALVLAWVTIARILSPLKSLTQSVRSIQDCDQSLRRRIPIRGTVEITELTTTFNEMLDRLQTSFASQREFIQDASHELQTPITVIRGNLELLGQSLGKPYEAMALMHDELDRMSRLVDDLLLLARAERPDFLNLELLEVSSFTQELLAKLKALATRHWNLVSIASVKIVADRHRLTQALMNLMQNAVEHTQPGDTIELGSRLVNQAVWFWVEDTGSGIAPADQERILQRFARGANSRRKAKGAGLGLAIVTAIAEAHGGEVNVVSELGQGSRFSIIIPLDPP